MFLVRRPSAAAIDRFVGDSRQLPFSYGRIERVTDLQEPIDDEVFVIGRGADAFDRACTALTAWKQFDIGWVELFPQQAPVAIGTTVAVLIRHLGFWSLNASRVVYIVGSPREARFGYAYRTLTAHAEAGEELFEVFVDPLTDAVMYRIRAISRPYAMLARVGQPIVRLLQARFRRHSAAAMTAATRRA